MGSAGHIPVVDFSQCSLSGGQEVTAGSAATQELADTIVSNLQNIGFVYLKNHGIPTQQVNDANNKTGEFFRLPEEVKQVYARPDDINHGWVVLHRESLNPSRPADYKEAYSINLYSAKLWPEAHVPGFTEATTTLRKSCADLCYRFLQLLGLGLKLENFNLFAEQHNFDTRKNASTLRCLHYPALPESAGLKPGEVRCGEHTDYGTITLLFQDDAGGLEVRNRDGVYIPAPPIDGTVVVNIGDLMQRWTSDRLVSNEHRVLLPKSEDTLWRRTRRSVAFFCDPDREYVVECHDGNNKYPPIRSIDYIWERFHETMSQLPYSQHTY